MSDTPDSKIGAKKISGTNGNGGGGIKAACYDHPASAHATAQSAERTIAWPGHKRAEL